MKTKRSPFDKRISAKEVYKACTKYFKLTGHKITFDLEEDGKVGLYSNGTFLGRFFNWAALVMINRLISSAEKDLATKPGGIVRIPILSKETYQQLIENLDNAELYRLLQLFKVEYEAVHTHNPGFQPDEMLRSQMDGVCRYINVYERYNCWDTKPRHNIKVLLKRYRTWVMAGVNRQYTAGNRILDRHNIPLT